MRIRILALSGALAASTLLAAPAMADEPPAPSPGTAAPAQAQVKFRNSCNPSIAALPPAVEGDPGIKPGALDGVAGPGLYVYHEAGGWRVRLTHNLAKVPDGAGGSKPQVIEVRGRITSSRSISNVRTVRLEAKQAGEWVSVHRPKRRVMEFRFVNGGYVDGINFNAGCAGRIGITVWQVIRDAAGKVTGRAPLPVHVGAARTQVTPDTTPALAPSQPDRTRVVIWRTPVG